jgi:16S rRNA (cytosine967-C5)-methyltransferase
LVALVQLSAAVRPLPDPNRLDLSASDERLLARAGRPGRLRAAVLDGLAAARRAPLAAAPVLRAHFRAATWLHSAERRFASDLVRDVLRWEQLLDGLVRDPGTDAARLRRLLSARGAAPTTSDLETAVRVPDPVASWARFASLPIAFVRSLWGTYGDATPVVVASLQGRAPLGLRVDLRRATREEAVALLARDGVVAVPGAHAQTALVVDERVQIGGTEAWRRGWIDVQDEASQAVVEALSDGDVLDLCAGAGGKALALAERGRAVVATDLRPDALRELARRADRARVAIRIVDPCDLPARADIVLVDAPCSGLGTLRRHPELRLGWTTPLRSAAAQRDLIERVVPSVACDAVAWVTCSLLAEENEEIVEAPHPGASWRRWDPAHHGTDGMTLGVSRASVAGIRGRPRRAR